MALASHGILDPQLLVVVLPVEGRFGSAFQVPILELPFALLCT